MEDYLVSVIIPAYNVESYLAQTIDSVLTQKWHNLEIILINDGSTDNTEKIIQSFISDKRIIYIRQDNSGCSSAKNTGLRRAKGDFIQYLDADDILSEDKIREQVEALALYPKKIAICRTIKFSETPMEKKENEIDTEFLEFKGSRLEFLLNLNGNTGIEGMIQPNAFLISKQLSELIGEWDINLSPSPDEDSEYFCRAILAADDIVYTPGGINYYRSVPNRISLSMNHDDKRIFGGLKTIDKKAEHLLAFEDSFRVRKVLAFQYSNFIYKYFDSFPKYTEIAKQRIKDLGFDNIPVSGGYRFRKVAKVMGMKNTLVLRKILKNIR